MTTKNIFGYVKLCLMMICSIVGVGFVSGAEIYSFYVRFGNFAYLGVFVFFVLMNFLLNKIFKDFENNENVVKVNNLNKNNAKNTFLTRSNIKTILINLNVLLVASAMFAGLFSLIKNLFNHNYFTVGIFAIVLVYFVLYFGAKGLEKFDVIVICLIIFVCMVFIKNLAHDIDFCLFDVGDFSLKQMCFSVLFAVLYLFMNIIQVQPVIAEFKPKFSPKARKNFVFVFSTMLSSLLLIFVLFLKNNFEFSKFEMPFLNFFKTRGNFVKILFVLGLFMSLMSSLLSCLIGVKNFLKNKIKSNVLSVGGAILISMLLSLIGFSNFVKFVYPIVGLINFVIFVFL